MLVIFSGLPGAGKTTLARALAVRLQALYLRIDTIEQAIRHGLSPDGDVHDLGYRVAYDVADENVRMGRSVIADSVNPIQLTRDAWLDVARQAGVRAFEVEVRCSDADEHRRRVETRSSDVRGLKLPSWADVVAREYEPWDREHVVIDTAERSVEESVLTLLESVEWLRASQNGAGF